MNSSQLYRLIEKTLSTFPKGKALDLGAGTGDKSLLIVKAGFDLTAVEYKRSNAKILREKGLNTVCRDMRKFQFNPEFYSLVFASASLDFLERKDKIRLIKKIYRSLKPGGHIFFWVFSEKDPIYISAQKWKKVGKNTYVFPVKIRNHARQISFFSKEEWRKILGAAGFKNISIKSLYIKEWLPSRHDHNLFLVTANK